MMEDFSTPQSAGALLAEEWTIQPHSILPSFLELKFIENASVSGRLFLKSLIGWLVHVLRDYNGDDRDHLQFLRRPNPTGLGAIFHRIGRRFTMPLATFLQRNSVEIRCLLLYLIERWCLQTHSGTVAEIMYGTRRVLLSPTIHKDSSPTVTHLDQSQSRRRLIPFRDKDAVRLALALALFPYLNEKLEEVRNLPPTSNVRQRYQRLLPALQWVKIGLLGSNWWCQWRYLLRQSFCYDAVSLYLGHVVRRVTQQDVLQGKTNPDLHHDHRNPPPTTGNIDQPRAANSKSTERVSSTILSCVSVAIAMSFITQLRVIWIECQQHQEREEGPHPNSQNEVLPPPHDAFRATSNKQACPICLKPWIEPIAAPSGVVYCRKCLFSYLRYTAKTCPLTGMDCPENRTVRLYEPNQ